MFEACSGDCILIHFLKEEYIILIDGGYADTYYSHLKPELTALAEKNKRINLMIITHIDDDHIGGIEAFLKENGSDEESNIIKVDEVWYNGFFHMNKAEISNGKMSYIQAEFLQSLLKKSEDNRNGKKDVSVKRGNSVAGLLLHGKYNWNTSYANKSICIEAKTVLKLTENITLVLLNPTEKSLEKLAQFWIRELRKKVKPFVICTDEVFDAAFESHILKTSESYERIKTNISKDNSEEADLADFVDELDEKEDDSKTNLSSIAFLLEYNDLKLLFPGDCPIHRFYKKLPSNIDVVKLPHHGSGRNINKEFVRNKSVGYYLVSTNGKKHGHPSKTIISNILYNAPIYSVIYKNYEYDLLKGIGKIMR